MSKRMNDVDVARAWKDEAYRESLSPEQRQALPANPAGAIELTDSQTASVAGGCAMNTTLELHVESIETTCHCPSRIVPRDKKVAR